MTDKEMTIEISIDGNILYRRFKIQDFERIALTDWNPTIISMTDIIKESSQYKF
jgi:hypothetical protein